MVSGLIYRLDTSGVREEWNGVPRRQDSRASSTISRKELDETEGLHSSTLLTFIPSRLTPAYSRTPAHISRIMPTDLPYAAEAESSLSFDELEVSLIVWPHRPRPWPLALLGHVGIKLTRTTGLAHAILQRDRAGTCDDAVKVQLWCVLSRHP